MMKVIPLLFLLLLSYPAVARATQGHGGPEGLYAHQFAHLFFMFAMALLLYWLRKRRLIVQSGWRLIQYAALFFILWNAGTLVTHFLEEQSTILTIAEPNQWRLHIDSPRGWRWLTVVYYIVKLDHLLSVPAVLFLFLGLRRLVSAIPHDTAGSPAP